MFYNIVVQHGIFVVYLCTHVPIYRLGKKSLHYIDFTPLVKNPNNRLTCLVIWAGENWSATAKRQTERTERTTEPTEPATERQGEPIERTAN